MSDIAGHLPAAGNSTAISTLTAGTPPRRRWWPLLRLVAVLAILVALISLLGTKAFAAGLNVLSTGAVIAALGIGLLTTVLNALRWRAVARRVGLELRLGDAIAETYRAIFLNAVLPGGVLGDVDRAVRHGRSSGDVGRGARAVAIERTAGQLVLVAAAVVLILAEPAMILGVLGHASRAPLIGIAVVVLLLVGGGLLVVRTRRSAHQGRWRRMLGDTAADVRAGVLSRTAWPLLILLSAAALAGYLVLFLVAARSAGATAPIVALLPPLLLALMAMGLPISIGGWGPREGVAALGFWMAGLGAPLGVSTSVAYGALALISSLPGAAVLLARRFARSRERAALAEASTGPIQVAPVEVAPIEVTPIQVTPIEATQQRAPRHRLRTGGPSTAVPDEGTAEGTVLRSRGLLGRRRGPVGNGGVG